MKGPRKWMKKFVCALSIFAHSHPYAIRHFFVYYSVVIFEKITLTE